MALINDIVLRVTVRRKTCTNFSDRHQDTFGTLILYRSVTVFFDVQQNRLELQKMVYLAINFVQFSPTSPSSFAWYHTLKMCVRMTRHHMSNMFFVFELYGTHVRYC